MSTEENIKKELQVTENIYRATQAVIDAMPLEGESRRMQIKDMAEAVGVAVGMAPKDVLHMVNRYAHNSVGGYVTRGKKGGYIKGVKPVKVDKPASLKVDSSVSVATDSVDDSDADDLDNESLV